MKKTPKIPEFNVPFVWISYNPDYVGNLGAQWAQFIDKDGQYYILNYLGWDDDWNLYIHEKDLPYLKYRIINDENNITYQNLVEKCTIFINYDYSPEECNQILNEAYHQAYIENDSYNNNLLRDIGITINIINKLKKYPENLVQNNKRAPILHKEEKSKTDKEGKREKELETELEKILEKEFPKNICENLEKKGKPGKPSQYDICARIIDTKKTHGISAALEDYIRFKKDFKDDALYEKIRKKIFPTNLLKKHIIDSFKKTRNSETILSEMNNLVKHNLMTETTRKNLVTKLKTML